MSKSKSRYVQVCEENIYSSLSNHNEAKLSSSSSTIGLDAQPSARPTALQSSRSMGLDLVPSSIAAHSTISMRYAVSCAIKVYSISTARGTSTQIQHTCTTEVVLIQINIFQLKMLKNSPKLIHETNVTLHRDCQQ